LFGASRQILPTMLNALQRERDSHLRNPLQGIFMATEMLSARTAPDKPARLIDQAN